MSNNDIIALKERAPDDATIRFWMSALIDGELGDAEQELFFATLDVRDDLLLEFNAFVDYQSQMSRALPDDFSAQIMSQVQPENTDEVQMQISQLIDGEHEAFELAAEQLEASSEFLKAAHVVKENLAQLTMSESSKQLVERSMQVIESDQRCEQLLSLLIDGETTLEQEQQLVALLSDPEHADFRQTQMLQIVRVHDVYAQMQVSLQQTLLSESVSEQIMHNIDVGAHQVEERVVRQQEVESKSWVAAAFEKFFPLTSALAMATSCLLILVNFSLSRHQENSSEVDHPAQKTVLAFADIATVISPENNRIQENSILLGEVLDDNEIEIEDLESDNSVMVFATEISNITVIWINDDAPDIDEDEEIEL